MKRQGRDSIRSAGDIPGRLLVYGDRPAGAFRFLTGLAESAHAARNIGPYMPDVHARRLVAVVIDQFLKLVEALYEAGWEDLLGRVS